MYRAGPPLPGARLLAAASFLAQGGTAADIGCDHGKLAVHLVCTGKKQRVVAVDKRPLPLARAEALAKQCGCADRVSCRLGDGLLALRPGEADELVIAGLSGETIAEIIAAVPWARDGALHFVLAPSGRASFLRAWLAENGFAVKAEAAVEERGKYYAVLSAAYTGETAVLCGLERELGLLRHGGGPAAAGLARQRLRDLRNRLSAPLPAQERAALIKTIEEVEACLPLMK